jgi:hypothetical protein
MRNSLICYAENAGVGYKECARRNESAVHCHHRVRICRQGMATPHEGLRLSIRCREANPPLPGGTADISRAGQILVLSHSARQTISAVMRGDELAQLP